MISMLQKTENTFLGHQRLELLAFVLIHKLFQLLSKDGPIHVHSPDRELPAGQLECWLDWRELGIWSAAKQIPEKEQECREEGVPPSS